MGVSKIRKSKNFDVSKYIHAETGEPLSTEIKKGVSMKIIEDTGLLSVTSSNYCSCDYYPIRYLTLKLSSSDIGNILKMAITLKTEWNLVCNSSIPHTNNTLMEYLGFNSRSMYGKFIKRMIDFGVLKKQLNKIDGRATTTYIMNPFIGRKRKQIKEYVFVGFDDFEKKYHDELRLMKIKNKI